MTKNETINEIKRQIKRWSYIVTHYGWGFTFYYHDTQEDMPEVAGICAAYTTANFNYLRASIHINLRACSDYDKEEIEEIVVHELTHILLSALGSVTGDVEYVVTSISKVMLGLRNK
jgi:hypothetical protein